MARISLWQQRVQVTVLRCSEGTLPPQPGPDHADPGTLDNVLDVCPPLLFIEELVHLVEFKTHYWISKLKTQTSSNSTPWLKTTPNYRQEKIALMKIVMCLLSVTLGKHPMGWSFLFLWSHACAVHRHGQCFFLPAQQPSLSHVQRSSVFKPVPSMSSFLPVSIYSLPFRSRRNAFF